mmetsp:Transcript_140516/g.244614  ORF Transcript_140516/g.244614 Transcript_140516/m.244614 type:complete len:103 (+) Transcript_140516:963-1271(+)
MQLHCMPSSLTKAKGILHLSAWWIPTMVQGDLMACLIVMMHTAGAVIRLDNPKPAGGTAVTRNALCPYVAGHLHTSTATGWGCNNSWGCTKCGYTNSGMAEC